MSTPVRPYPSAVSRAPRRTRGQRAGLDLGQIVLAARALPPEDVTVSAVAGLLGVDRKALHNYISGREELLGLVAGSHVEDALRSLHIPEDADWQTVTRLLARGLHAGYVAAGHVVEYLVLTPSEAPSLLKPLDRLLQQWVDAGFSSESALRGLYYLGSTVWTHARDEVLNSREGGHPQMGTLRVNLDASAEREIPAVYSMLSHAVDFYGDEGLEFQLQVFIAGMERVLARETTPGRRGQAEA